MLKSLRKLDRKFAHDCPPCPHLIYLNRQFYCDLKECFENAEVAEV